MCLDQAEVSLQRCPQTPAPIIEVPRQDQRLIIGYLGADLVGDSHDLANAAAMQQVEMGAEHMEWMRQSGDLHAGMQDSSLLPAMVAEIGIPPSDDRESAQYRITMVTMGIPGVRSVCPLPPGLASQEFRLRCCWPIIESRSMVVMATDDLLEHDDVAVLLDQRLADGANGQEPPVMPEAFVDVPGQDADNGHQKCTPAECGSHPAGLTIHVCLDEEMPIKATQMSTWLTLFLVSEWVIRLTTVIYVPQRRSPAAARTWPGLFAYALFGHIALPRSRRALHARMAERIAMTKRQWHDANAPLVAPPENFKPIAKLAEALGGFPAIAGNRLDFLHDYQGFIDRLVQDIDGAMEHVHLLYYLFALDSVGTLVTAALLRAVNRKVACRLVLDSAGSRRDLTILIAELEPFGVEIIESLPAGLMRRKAARFDLRNHRKLAIIDGTIAYAGSQNIISGIGSGGSVQRELGMRIVGPVVAELQVVFLTDRFNEVEKTCTDRNLFPPHQELGGATMQALPSGPAYGQANFKMVAQSLIQAARFRVFLTTPYFIPDEAFLECLQMAVMRGVEVTLMVSLESDSRLVSWAEQSFYERMLADGVHIRLFEPSFLHAKHLSIDDQVAVVGSSNLDIRSFTLNNEISLIIYDASVVGELVRVECDYVVHSHELTAETWEKRGVLQRIGQNMMRLADALL